MNRGIYICDRQTNLWFSTFNGVEENAEMVNKLKTAQYHPSETIARLRRN
jgi:hypothetical protein